MKNYLTRINHSNGPLDLFNDAFGDFFRPIFFDEKLDSMKTDIKETENAYELDVEMPGFEKSDIEIDLSEGYLTIRAEKHDKEEDGEGKHRYVRKERSVSCQRSYFVGDIAEDSVKAKYNNGVLSVCLPKAVQKKPETKNITIE